jgi:4-hydroxybenzoyl-CoA reductase subunit beta
MLPLPEFTLHSPRSVEDAVALMEQLGPTALVLAGGTDLLPNMKQGLRAPEHLVSLQSVGALRGIRRDAATLVIGAMTSLEAVAEDAEVRRQAAALAEAAEAVGGPQHRRMGTLGGNLCLDTRCRYYNQTQFWRSALGFCLKKDGDTCHVVEGGKRCVAAASNDTAAAAIALEAVLVIHGPRGVRRVSAGEFFIADGARNVAIEHGELLVSVEIPLRSHRVSVYEKLRRRGAIDFPLLSIAVRIDTARIDSAQIDSAQIDSARINDVPAEAASTGDRARKSSATSTIIEQLDIVVSALAAKPRRIGAAKKLDSGRLLTELPIDDLAEAAARECNPMPNIEGDVGWRKQMVRVMVKRALLRAANEAGVVL